MAGNPFGRALDRLPEQGFRPFRLALTLLAITFGTAVLSAQAADVLFDGPAQRPSAAGTAD